MNVYPIVPLRSIAIVVATLHVVLLGWLLWFAPAHPTPVKPKSMNVQTVKLNPRHQTTMKEPPKVEPKKINPTQQPAPKPTPAKPEPVKPPPKATAKAPAKPTPKNTPKVSLKSIAKPAPKEIAQVEPAPKKGPSKESLQAFKQKLASIPAFTTAPSTATSASSYAAYDISFAYEEELVSRLKILLKLPEMGDVKVALTLNRQGKVIKSEILSSANAANRKAIETHLPALQFPSFGKAYDGENTHTFTLTLTNL